MSAVQHRMTQAAPHVRSSFNAQRLLSWFVVASLPAAAAGLWIEPGRAVGFAAQAALAIAVCGTWEWIFGRLRNRPVDPAWFVNGWLFALLLPPATPFLLLVGTMSFGVVLAHHVFGGTGKALVSPALLGVLAIHFGYPEIAAAPGLITTQEVPAGFATQDWWAALVGHPGGPLGSTSTLACLIGALILVRSGAASARLMLGAGAGMLITAMLIASGDGTSGALPWHWHPLVGTLSFAAIFIATDPSTSALTRAGRWLHGLLIGVFTVLIRSFDPTHPDGALFAVLMAGLTVPLLDHLVYRRHVARRRRREAEVSRTARHPGLARHQAEVMQR